MFNAIDEVKRQYMYSVQPVRLFETRNSKPIQKDLYEFLTEMKVSGNNPFHPDVSNSERGSHLDIMV